MAAQPIDADVDEFLDYQRAWSPANRTNAVAVLNRFTRWLAATHDVEPAAATRRQCRDYLDHVATTPGPKTGRLPKGSSVQCHWRQLRAFYTWAKIPRIEGGIGLAASPMDGVVAPVVVEPVLKTAKPAEVEALFRAFDRSRLGRRNAAMLSLMYHNGLRVGELAVLDLAHYRTQDNGQAWLLVPKSKTNRQRDIPVDPTAQKYLRRWLSKRGLAAGPLFLGETTRPTDIGGRLSAESIRQNIDRAAVRARVDVSCHQLRRAFVINAKAKGMSDATICLICGWTSTRMMMRYMADERTASAGHDFYRCVGEGA